MTNANIKNEVLLRDDNIVIMKIKPEIEHAEFCRPSTQSNSAIWTNVS